MTGYSPAHLGRLVREGKIPNHGRTNAPRVRRGDLPVKALPGGSEPVNPVRYRAEQIVRSIAKPKEASGG